MPRAMLGGGWWLQARSHHLVPMVGTFLLGLIQPLWLMLQDEGLVNRVDKGVGDADMGLSGD